VTLEDALRKLHATARIIPIEDAKPAYTHPFIAKTLSGKGQPSLFSTHPPQEERGSQDLWHWGVDTDFLDSWILICTNNNPRFEWKDHGTLSTERGSAFIPSILFIPVNSVCEGFIAIYFGTIP
jgi:hypothetical protein